MCYGCSRLAPLVLLGIAVWFFIRWVKHSRQRRFQALEMVVGRLGGKLLRHPQATHALQFRHRGQMVRLGFYLGQPKPLHPGGQNHS